MAGRARKLAGIGAATMAVAGLGAFTLAHRPPHPPQQPVPFSHAHHVGEVGLDCRFCHWAVERGPRAGMPDMQTCAGCHWPVAGRPAPEPLEWRPVARLPGHVFFDHQRHRMDCATCHGAVATMERTRAAERPWTMRWCLDCHRAQAMPARLTTCTACHR